MAKVVYEGPDDVLVVGTVELHRGVPTEVSAQVAKVAAAFPGVLSVAEGPRRERPRRGEGEE